MAMTAKPMLEASTTRQPSCSRIAIRILTILCGHEPESVFRRREKGWAAEPRDAAGISQLHFARAEQRAGRGSREACRAVYISFLAACTCIKQAAVCAGGRFGKSQTCDGFWGAEQACWGECTTRAASRMQRARPGRRRRGDLLITAISWAGAQNEGTSRRALGGWVE
jgi:hypothetical protein